MLSEFSRDGSLVAISGDGRGVFGRDNGIQVFPPPVPPARVISGCYNGRALRCAASEPSASRCAKPGVRQGERVRQSFCHRPEIAAKRHNFQTARALLCS
jgi:hypothetical protein